MLSDGSFAGTLCAADPEPRPLRDAEVNAVIILARLVATNMEREQRALEKQEQARLEGVLLAARTFEHELFNKLSGTLGWAQMLARSNALPDRERGQANQVVRSTQEATRIIHHLLQLTYGDMSITDWGSTSTIDVAPHPAAPGSAGQGDGDGPVRSPAAD